MLRKADAVALTEAFSRRGAAPSLSAGQTGGGGGGTPAAPAAASAAASIGQVRGKFGQLEELASGVMPRFASFIGLVGSGVS